MWSLMLFGESERWVANTGKLVVRRKWRVRARDRPLVAGQTRTNGLAGISIDSVTVGRVWSRV